MVASEGGPTVLVVSAEGLLAEGGEEQWLLGNVGQGLVPLAEELLVGRGDEAHWSSLEVLWARMGLLLEVGGAGEARPFKTSIRWWRRHLARLLENQT